LSKEDVAALLNDMAPDDRTMFLEELPATATRELLALLTPKERAVAVTLLGYPEKSIGRLMTPDYVAVREGWTIQQVLDYVRTHGQDSETLNVIYVIDEQGLLIDDIRIREFLLRDPASRVSELMDRRFVALKATDDQQTAVAAFRQHDRSALPVTDSAGVLIGIVTVDDVLDVAETEATKDIQRIGGSEALDEPYMEIGFVLWGTLIGSVLPLILRRLGFDPATSSAPFVATLVDVTGLVIYFSIALVVLHGTLL